MARCKLSGMKLLIWSLLLQTVWARNKTKFNGTPPIAARSQYEQYTLGQQQEGAKLIYTYQYTQTYNESQQEISLDFHYPNMEEYNEAEGVDDAMRITQIDLFVRSEDGSDTQAFVTEGGIGANNISLQVIGVNTKYLNYILIIYGKNEQ